MAVGEGDITLEARVRDFATAQLAKVQRSVDRFGQRADRAFGKFRGIISNSGKEFASFAARFGPAALAIGGVLAAVNALGQGIDKVRTITDDYEKTLSNVRAVLQPTEQDFDALNKKARELGRSTVFTASQSGQAFLEMGKLGFKTNQILASTEDVLNLAAAANVDLAAAGEVTVKTLNQFQLSAEDAQRVTDVMGKSFVSSALDFNKFSESMKFVGTSARLVGLDLEETTAMLAVLANNGIEASMAGTSLNQALTQLASPGSKVNKLFKTLGKENATVSEKMRILAEQNIDVGESFDLLDVKAARALNVLLENIPTVDRLGEEFKQAEGSIKKMADTMQENVIGALKILTSAQEDLAIATGNAMSEERRQAILAQAEATQRLAEVVERTDKSWAGVASTLGTKVKTAFIDINTALLKSGEKFGLLNTLMNRNVTVGDRLSERISDLTKKWFEFAKLRMQGVDSDLAGSLAEGRSKGPGTSEAERQALMRQSEIELRQKQMGEQAALEKLAAQERALVETEIAKRSLEGRGELEKQHAKELQDFWEFDHFGAMWEINKKHQEAMRELDREDMDFWESNNDIVWNMNKKHQEAMRAEERKTALEKRKHEQAEMQMMNAQMQLMNARLTLAQQGLGLLGILVSKNKELIPVLQTIKALEIAIATARSIAGATGPTAPLAIGGAVLGGLGGALGLFQSGGTVQGRPGEPRLVVAHGGEKITPSYSITNHINFSPTTTVQGGGNSDKAVMDVIDRQPERLAKIIGDIQRRGFA